MLHAYGQVFQSVFISNSATEGYSILYKKKKKIDGLRLRDKFLPKILFEMSCSAIISALKNNMFMVFVHQYRAISVLVRKIKQMALSCYFFSVFFSFFPSISFLNDSGGSNSESIEHDKYLGIFISKFETFLGKLLCSIVADRFHYFHVSN